VTSMLEVRDLVKVYDTGMSETPALGGVNITVESGEYVAIMGPSGSGKSTLMNIIGCLDTPTSGTYLLDGEDVAGLDDDDLAWVRSEKIGFVFQSFNLLARATVMRNVTLPLVYARINGAEREERAMQALADVGLPEELWDHRSNELSGGQMQRVAIARALVTDPALILADEPTGNLDTATGEQVLATFARLNKQGRTIVLITHEADVAAHASRVIHVRDGMIVDEVEAVQADARAAEERQAKARAEEIVNGNGRTKEVSA
jgi:putative ABC transport system ATP-binding protein